MSLTYRPRASRDIKELADYVARDNPPAAEKLRTRIQQSVLILRHHPELDRETAVPDLRRWQIPGLAYAAYYIIDRDRIRIMRVLHGARRWPDSFYD